MEKLERREVILMAGGAVAGAAVGTVFSGAPFLGLQWLVEWTQDQHVPAPGEESYLQGKCLLCPSACPISVRMIGNRAVKVETANNGCYRPQLAIQMLYHPERLKSPLKRAGKKGSGKFAPVSWEEAIKDIAAKIDELRSGGKAAEIAAINGAGAFASAEVLKRLVKSAGSPNVYSEPCYSSLSAAASGLTQGQSASIYYDFVNADFILSFGARLVEGWGGDPGRMNRAFVDWKRRGARYVQIDTVCTRSASAADRWVPLNAGTETVLALGIANQLIAMGRRSAGANFAQWSQIVINDYTPERVAEITGVGVDAIKEIAAEFARARNPIAVAGRGASAVSSSSVEFAAIQALNSMVGSLGRRGGVMLADYSGLGDVALNAQAAKGLDDFIKNGSAGLLFINDANPVHRSVYGKTLADKMKKDGMVVALMPLLNDSAAYADYVLPTISSIEGEPIEARFKSMHPVDALLSIAGAVKGLENALPWKSFKDVYPLIGRLNLRGAGNFAFPVGLLKDYLAGFAKKIGDKKYPLALVPVEAPMVGDGDGMALPYVLKGLDGLTLTGSKLWVMMNPDTAKQEGVSEGSRIDIESSRGEIGSVKVHITKTVAPGAVAIPLGFGHEFYTKYAGDKGVNAKEIMSDDIDPISGAADWWFTRVKIS
ncbi:MAG TPA: molybdopterin-dependent oxidoreductase [Spirochaetota bacterium]|nr:molybdopterin-dependent oxidoreductase [Spirochaetota bacterium]